MDGQEWEMLGARIGQNTLYFMPALIESETSQIIVPEVTTGGLRQLGRQEFVPRFSPPFENIPVL